jgi:hypothetical protein
VRTAARKDRNHNEVVAAFEKFGWEVLDVSQLKNCCDIFISKRWITVAVEIKDGSAKDKRQHMLTDGEEGFRARWKGHYEVVLSLQDVEAVNRRYMANSGPKIG